MFDCCESAVRLEIISQDCLTLSNQTVSPLTMSSDALEIDVIQINAC
jgi:hypothetical protein